jgi:hypothetical protein
MERRGSFYTIYTEVVSSSQGSMKLFLHSGDFFYYSWLGVGRIGICCNLRGRVIQLLHDRLYIFKAGQITVHLNGQIIQLFCQFSWSLGLGGSFGSLGGLFSVLFLVFLIFQDDYSIY